MVLISDRSITEIILVILGTGCPKCKQLSEVTEPASQELGLEYDLEKVTNLQDIMARGAMMTPALVVDGELKVSGKVPSVEEIKRWLA